MIINVAKKMKSTQEENIVSDRDREDQQKQEDNTMIRGKKTNDGVGSERVIQWLPYIANF